MSRKDADCHNHINIGKLDRSSAHHNLFHFIYNEGRTRFKKKRIKKKNEEKQSTWQLRQGPTFSEVFSYYSMFSVAWAQTDSKYGDALE